MLRADAGNRPPSDEYATTEALKERQRRRSLGIYYTPPRAATLLAQWAIRSVSDTVLEPSFGGCALLAAAADVYRAFGVREPSNRFIGYDVDPAALEHLAAIGLSGDKGRFHLRDFLSSVPAETRVNAVLANPPFVSYHRMGNDQRERVVEWRRSHACPLNQRASLWAYFVLHATSFLADGGRMAFVLPTVLQTAEYAQPLLNELRERFSSVRVLNISEQLFIQEGADERVALLLLDGYSERRQKKPSAVTVNQIRSLDDVSVGQDFQIQVVRDSETRAKALRALHAISSKTRSLGDVARVDIGEVVGDVAFFVRERSRWRELGISGRYLVPLLTRTSQAKGVSLTQDHAKLALPHLLLPPANYRAQALRDVLRVWTRDKIRGNSTFRKREHWYRCSYDADADAFFASLTHEYPRLIANTAHVSCTNAFYRITVGDLQEYVPWLPAIALTAPFRLGVETYGRVLGAGGMKLDPRDLRRLPIPRTLPAPSESVGVLTRIDELVRNGEFASACQLADECLYAQLQTLSRAKLALLRELSHSLLKRRLRGLSA